MEGNTNETSANISIVSTTMSTTTAPLITTTTTTAPFSNTTDVTSDTPYQDTSDNLWLDDSYTYEIVTLEDSYTYEIPWLENPYIIAGISGGASLLVGLVCLLVLVIARCRCSGRGAEKRQQDVESQRKNSEAADHYDNPVVATDPSGADHAKQPLQSAATVSTSEPRKASLVDDIRPYSFTEQTKFQASTSPTEGLMLNNQINGTGSTVSEAKTTSLIGEAAQYESYDSQAAGRDASLIPTGSGTSDRKSELCPYEDITNLSSSPMETGSVTSKGGKKSKKDNKKSKKETDKKKSKEKSMEDESRKEVVKRQRISVPHPEQKDLDNLTLKPNTNAPPDEYAEIAFAHGKSKSKVITENSPYEDSNLPLATGVLHPNPIYEPTVESKTSAVIEPYGTTEMTDKGLQNVASDQDEKQNASDIQPYGSTAVHAPNTSSTPESSDIQPYGSTAVHIQDSSFTPESTYEETNFYSKEQPVREVQPVDGGKTVESSKQPEKSKPTGTADVYAVPMKHDNKTFLAVRKEGDEERTVDVYALPTKK